MLIFSLSFRPACLTGDITSHVLSVAMQARSRMLGPFSPSFNIQNLLKSGLEKVWFVPSKVRWTALCLHSVLF